MIGDARLRRHYVATILDALANEPDRPRVHWTGHAVTGRELARAIRYAYEKLRLSGVDGSAVVAIDTAPNHPVSLTARYAAHLLGATATYVRSTNPGSDQPLSDMDRRALLDDCGATHVATEADLDFGRESDNLGPYGPVAVPEHACVTYTSGSTGRPKGIRQRFVAWNFLVAGDSALLEPGAETMLVVTPTSHTVAAAADVVLAAGGTLVLHERFDPAEALAAIEKHQVTRTYLAVPQLYVLLDDPALPATDLGSLRQVLYSGCPASPERIAAAMPVLGHALVQCYGSTEAGRISLLDNADHHDPARLSSVGRVFPGVEVRIGQDGEVLVRSPFVMAGYERAWLPTGDLGRFDDDGYLHLTGRRSGVIKTNGVRVHPAEVEKALLTHPAVRQAVVWGAADGDGLESVHAAVVLRHDQPVRDLIVHVASALTPLHAPVRVTRWADLPLTDSGKPDLFRLQDRPESEPPS